MRGLRLEQKRLTYISEGQGTHRNQTRHNSHSLSNGYLRDEPFTYEELLALGDKIGYVSKGLSEHIHSQLIREEISEVISCSICLLDIELNTVVTRLTPCLHSYHCECIDVWLENNKTCPLCLQEITI